MPALSVSTQKLTSFEEARSLVLMHARPMGIDRVTLSESLQRVLAQDVIAGMNLPPFDNSAMDGYAVRSIDTRIACREQPIELKLVGKVTAGSVRDRPLGMGEAVKIMTGASLPPRADSVVALEDARLRGEIVQILEPVASGRHVRSAGEDIRIGVTALAAGTRLCLQHLGLLAGLGCSSLAVTRQPRVSVFATGSELVDVNEPLIAGKIRNSNSRMLVACLRRLGLQPLDLGAVIDDAARIKEQLERASAASDVILISGGVSVGEHDWVKRVLREIGMETVFWRVNMKPGKPLLFGRLGDKAVFGLPGNPISCVVGFLAFVAPFLRKVMGEPEQCRTLHARLDQAIEKKEARTQFLTAQLREAGTGLIVAPTPQQGSGLLNSLAQAEAFILIPAEVMRLEPGATVEVLPIGDGPWGW